MPREITGTLTNTTVSVAANGDRRGVLIGNPSDTAMIVRAFGGTASATAGFPLAAGDTVTLGREIVGTDAVSVFCAGTSKAYYIIEW